MGFPKKVSARSFNNKERAIKSHESFVCFVVGMVNKIGIDVVLQQYQPALGPPTQYFWLKKSYERVLKFAEEVQLKMLPTKLEGELTHIVQMPQIEIGNNRLEFNIGNN